MATTMRKWQATLTRLLNTPWDRDDLACFDCADRYRTPYSAVGWLAHLCLSAEPLGN
jgi:hypothetical protein